MPRSSVGYTDIAADCVALDALWKRVRVAEAMADRVSHVGRSPLALAGSVMGTSLRGGTHVAIRRADAPEQVVVWLFASP